MTTQFDLHCPRGRDDCEPLANVVSDEVVSFVCCGHNRLEDREFEKDCFTLCWKNAAVDTMDHWDHRDLIDTMSVVAQALSVDANMRENGEEGES